MLLVAEARVETEGSRRYLGQLCRHFNAEAKAHPDVQLLVEWSDDRGVADFGWGRCALRADPGVLTLRAEALDEEALQKLERLVAHHLDRFGDGGQLKLAWGRAGATTTSSVDSQQAPREAAALVDADPYPGSDDTGALPEASKAGRDWTAVVVTVVIALIFLMLILLHLGGGFRGPHS